MHEFFFFDGSLCLQFSEVPQHYDDVYLEMARRGARVLALGYKKLGVLSHQQVSSNKSCDMDL